MTHVITIEQKTRSTGAQQYRWACSCGISHPSWWSSRASGSHADIAQRRARNGGARHVAAMVRGKR